MLTFLLLISAFAFVVDEFSVGTVSALQEGSYTYTISGVGATITKYTGTDTDIIIPSTLGGYSTNAIGGWAFANCTNLTSIIIPNSIISMGNNSFFRCLSLTSVNIGSNVTSIGDYAFASCTALTSITIPIGVTTIGNNAFQSCTSLTKMYFEGNATICGKDLAAWKALGKDAHALVVQNATGSPQPGDADFPAPAPSQRHVEKVAAVKSGPYDLVLIGDSITHSIGELGGKYEPLKGVWERHYAPRRAINLGHNGYRTEQILWNLQNGELDFITSPKVAILLIGTNNSDDRHFATVHTAEEIFAGTKAIVELIRRRHPATKILVLRIFPRGGDAENRRPGAAIAHRDLGAGRTGGGLRFQPRLHRRVLGDGVRAVPRFDSAPQRDVA